MEGPAGGTGAEPRSERVQAFARGLAVIRCFDAEHPELGLADVARRTGMARAAARRFLLTLLDLGYVSTDGHTFRLTPRVLDLGYSYLSSLSLPELAQPHLERLSAQVRESCSVSVLDGGDIVYVARVATRRIMAATITVGTRFPAHATSMGRVLLAALEPAEAAARLRDARPRALTQRTLHEPEALLAELVRVRDQGFALVDRELEDGVRSLAVPLHRRGAVVAAVNVSVPASRFSTAQMRRDLLPRLRTCARAVEDDLTRG
ncbi:IclR family transcriptional regulator domain-containing protein [Kineococcus esterisolvens]|uniref:IclR family transcriptional regulator domain-containing protein n=1 Tax=unclassified Kineococcus TaxID=2621656 RepID=UPI003D7CA826